MCPLHFTHIVHFGIEGVFAGVLQHDFTRGLGVGATAVLVRPLDGQDAALVVVHALLLGELYVLACVCACAGTCERQVKSRG